MSIIAEIKRIPQAGEFAALVLPKSFGSLEHISGLYLESTEAQFERLRQAAANVSEKKAVVGAGEFFNRITLLDSNVHDSEQLMMLVDESNLKAIPPIEENILTVLDEGTQVDWKLELHNDGGKLSLSIFADGANAANLALSFETGEFALERFNPNLMVKEFFKI